MKALLSLLTYVKKRAKEPSTIAGVLTLAATLATGGTASWLNPTTLPVILAGLGLVVTKEN